ncbi:hypothetical protein D3C80_479660 [compost metagenome]
MAAWHVPYHCGGGALVPAVAVVSACRLAMERPAQSAGTVGTGRHLVADAEIHPLPPDASCLAVDSGGLRTAPGRFCRCSTQRYRASDRGPPLWEFPAGQRAGLVSGNRNGLCSVVISACSSAIICLYIRHCAGGDPRHAGAGTKPRGRAGGRYGRAGSAAHCRQKPTSYGICGAATDGGRWRGCVHVVLRAACDAGLYS